MKRNIEIHDPAKKLRALKTLRKLPIFYGLQNDEYEKLFSICTACTYKAKQTIFREKDASLYMYILLNGAVEISTARGGVIYKVRPGEIFGEFGLISQQSRTATAKVIDDSAVLRIERDDFNFLLGTQPRISAKLLRNITINLSNHIIRMNNLATTEYLPIGDNA